MLLKEMNKEELVALKNELTAKYEEIKTQGLSLDMSRGKPSANQLDLSMDMLKIMTTVEDCKAENGFDCRNYGVLDGMPECKKLFADILEETNVADEYIQMAKEVLEKSTMDMDTVAQIVEIAHMAGAIESILKKVPSALEYGLTTFYKNWNAMIEDIYSYNEMVQQAFFN